MKVLHYHGNNDHSMIAQYVETLCAAMVPGIVCEATDSYQHAKELLNGQHYDILHIHGCWHFTAYRLAQKALKNNIRIVLTPHGQLEPWVVNHHFWKEKQPKRLLFVKRLVQKAYAVIIQGKMEEECMHELGWNKRTVIIRNSLVTHSITNEDMAQQMALIYQKVMDSNPWELMTDDTKKTLQQLIKVGITGDERWLGEPYINITDHDQWRRLYCYIHQEQIADVVRRGLLQLRIDPPDFDIRQMTCYMPDDYESAKTIEEAIGMQYATENERLLATFRHLRKLEQHRKLTVMHLIELDKELRNHDCEEELLCEALQSHQLYNFARRLLQLTYERTGLTKGIMPVTPKNDWQTRRMRKYIDNHLKITI